MREPSRELDRKAIESRLPVTKGHGPPLGDVAHGQVEHLVDRLVRRKDAVIACHLA